MTVQIAGIIRDYDQPSDTCTVELTSGGAIDTWLDGVKIHVAVNRAYLAGDIPCVVTMPNAHRLCDAAITTVYPPVGLASRGSAGNVLVQNGRALMSTDASGNGSLTVTFPSAYVGTPTVSATVDQGTTTITAVSTTAFTASVTGAARRSGNLYLTWSATGT